MDIINNSGPSGTLGGCASIHWLKNPIKHLIPVQFFVSVLVETRDFRLILLFPQIGPPLFYRSMKCEQATERCTLIVSATFRAWWSLYRYSARCIGAVNENAFANHNLLRAASVGVHVAGARPSTWPRRTCPHFFGCGFPNSPPLPELQYLSHSIMKAEWVTWGHRYATAISCITCSRGRSRACG